MDREQDHDLQVVRRAYAKQVLWAANVTDPLIEATFASVPREHYVGDGPWPIMRSPGVYMATAPFEAANVIYVNCGLSRIPLMWIDGTEEAMNFTSATCARRRLVSCVRLSAKRNL